MPLKTHLVEAVFAISIVISGIFVAYMFRPASLFTGNQPVHLTVMCDSIYLTQGGQPRISIRHKPDVLVFLRDSKLEKDEVFALNDECKKEVINLECISSSQILNSNKLEVVRISKGQTLVWQTLKP